MPEKNTPTCPPTCPTDLSLVDSTYPVGVPLTAKYRQGFAFKTINLRLPVILTKIIDQLSRDKNEIGESYGQEARDDVKIVVGALAKFKNEMVTNKPIYKTGCKIWDSYLEQIAQLYFEGVVEEVKWYFAPWLHVECYFYKRIHDAFYLSEPLKSFDPFKKQKQEGFECSKKSAELLAAYISSSESSDTVLQNLLEVGLWGNRCDLSLSGGEEVSQLGNLVDQLQGLRNFVLCDESASFWKILKDAKTTNPDNPVTIGYVLDNAGFELVTDFCLADKLMDRVDRIDFYVKTTPWFISDALKGDFNWLIERMCNCSDFPALVTVGERWKGYILSKRWTVVESEFWTYPHAFFEMQQADPELYSTLAKHTHLIFKGDLNYRKLIGDFSWKPDTPFKDALRGFCPAPLISLRTLKADCIAGLRKGLAEEIESKSPDWLVSGEYGIMQHAQ
ncbi:unnamed protein product [Orchesella dallaii]|uniref:Sugar phosphate phosphatase n=1 Tax=Orchesella dallaii TaxID=48710 RepID=A0ABP1Q3D0_9HEXA